MRRAKRKRDAAMASQNSHLLSSSLAADERKELTQLQNQGVFSGPRDSASNMKIGNNLLFK